MWPESRHQPTRQVLLATQEFAKPVDLMDCAPPACDRAVAPGGSAPLAVAPVLLVRSGSTPLATLSHAALAQLERRGMTWLRLTQSEELLGAANFPHPCCPCHKEQDASFIKIAPRLHDPPLSMLACYFFHDDLLC